MAEITANNDTLKTFNVKMTRVYETIIEVRASTESEALVLAEKENNKFALEMEQCNVSSEEYEIQR